ncbi:MAG: hypothetical protein ABI690_31250 [Chloroflexota bacterium]
MNTIPNLFELIFDELNHLNNDEGTERAKQIMLNSLRPNLKEIRQAYKSSPSNVDYSSRFNRAAYLLAYYPHHIQIIRNILEKLPTNYLTEAFSNEVLKACFIGAGPSPEVIGWTWYLNQHMRHVKFAKAYLLDKYVDGWRGGQEITRYRVAPVYWPEGHLTLIPIEFDFTEFELLKTYMHEDPPSTTRPDDVYYVLRAKRAFQCSNFFVMQNCLNDQLNNRNQLLRCVVELFQLMPSGSIFVLADLGRKEIRDFLKSVENTILQNSLGDVLSSPQNNVEKLDCAFDSFPILTDELFSGENGLWERKATYYYSAAFIRS